MGQHRHFSCSKIPQHGRAPAVPTQTGTRGCLLRGHSFALLWWQLKGACQSQPGAPSWPHCHKPSSPCPSTTCSTTMCLSNEHHGCHTAEGTGPRQSQPIPIHLWLTRYFHFVTLPQKIKKKKSGSCDISNSLWDLKHLPQ